MANCKDCNKCYHRYACAGDTDKWNYYGECPHYVATADVVPRSEAEELQKRIGNQQEEISERKSARGNQQTTQTHSQPTTITKSL